MNAFEILRQAWREGARAVRIEIDPGEVEVTVSEAFRIFDDLNPGESFRIVTIIPGQRPAERIIERRLAPIPTERSQEDIYRALAIVDDLIQSAADADEQELSSTLSAAFLAIERFRVIKPTCGVCFATLDADDDGEHRKMYHEKHVGIVDGCEQCEHLGEGCGLRAQHSRRGR